MSIDQASGKISGAPESITPRTTFTVTLKNTAGSTEFPFSLEVQEHSTFSVQYPPEYHSGHELHVRQQEIEYECTKLNVVEVTCTLP